jgi:TetR/AcrR family transcriptional regulator, transcriptional repressor for nem operon
MTVAPALASNAPRDTKRAILDLAEGMIQERGFNGFSYQDIARALGVKNAAVHYHFRSKSDLGVAVVERYQRRFRRWSEGLDAARLGAWPRLEAFFDIYRSFVRNARVCPNGVLAAEFHTLPEEVREATRTLVAEFHAWLIRLLEQGRDQGAFQFKGEAADQAAVIGAALQGGIQMARAAGSDTFESVVAQLRRQLQP